MNEVYRYSPTHNWVPGIGGMVRGKLTATLAEIKPPHGFAFGEVREDVTPEWAGPWVAVKPTHSTGERGPTVPARIFYGLKQQVAWPEDVKLMFRYPIPGMER